MTLEIRWFQIILLLLLLASPRSYGSEQIVERTFLSKSGLKSIYSFLSYPGADRLLIFFHGSGGAKSYATPLTKLKPLRKKFKIHLMSIRSPTRGNWPEKSPNNQSHVEYTREIIKHVQKGYKFKELILVGYSAGSTFVSGDFIPKYDFNYKLRGILLCGGGWPLSRTLDSTDVLRKKVQLYFRIGRKDFLFDQVMATMAFYAYHKISLKKKVTEEGHCQFPLRTSVEEGLVALGL